MRHADQNADQHHIHDPIQNDGQGSVTVPSPRDAPTIGTEVEVDPERQAADAAVVAEAVALALEATTAEAVKAVLATAAAVSEAAGRAADTAENARQARAWASDAAAQAVAHEVARTAARERIRADLAVTRVHQAASLAADALAQSIADGTALDTGRMAELCAATVRAAADAAAHVSQTVAAAESAAPVTEQHARTVDREADSAERHFATPAPEAHAPVRTEETEEILAAADERDSRAEIRDQLADERERAASLRSFIGDQQYEEYEQHAVGLPVRRAAAMDRLDSQTDRASAASDRARLADHLSPGSQAWEATSGSHVTEVVAELSHDLRVPLSSIIASVEMLEDELGGNSDRTVAAHLGRAMRAGYRMVRMLDQNMTSHTPGKPTTVPEIDLAEIVRQLVLDSADLLEPVGAVVETGELPVVRADPDEMYSVLQNLITNSVKFARPGVPAIVRISARPSVDGWRISVRDNGVGLPDDSDLDVFSLFGRGTSAVTGHGIGLATVARIVTAHGGRVGAAPAETGAEIWFELLEDEAVR